MMPTLTALPAHTATSPTGHEWLGCHPFRAHVRHLLASTPVEADVLALVAGVPAPTVRRLATRPPRFGERVRRVDAERLLAVTPSLLRTVGAERVDAALPRLWLLRLVHRGWSLDDLALESGLSRETLQTVVEQPAALCTRLDWLRIEAAQLRIEAAAPAAPRVAARAARRAA